MHSVRPALRRSSPGKPGYGSRQIETEDDVRDAIRMLRLNYDRAVERHGLPAAT